MRCAECLGHIRRSQIGIRCRLCANWYHCAVLANSIANCSGVAYSTVVQNGVSVYNCLRCVSTNDVDVLGRITVGELFTLLSGHHQDDLRDVLCLPYTLNDENIWRQFESLYPLSRFVIFERRQCQLSGRSHLERYMFRYSPIPSFDVSCHNPVHDHVLHLLRDRRPICHTMCDVVYEVQTPVSFCVFSDAPAICVVDKLLDTRWKLSHVISEINGMLFVDVSRGGRAVMGYYVYESPIGFVNAETSLHVICDHHRCDKCGVLLFGGETSTLCCSNGEHRLRFEEVELPDSFRDFYDEFSYALVDQGREINQLMALTAVGVQSSSGSVYGGVQLRYPESYAVVDGRIFHFQLDARPNRLSRSHPLLGSARTYLFHDPTADEMSSFPNAEISSIVLRGRSLLRAHNVIICEFVNRYGCVNMSMLAFDSLAIEFCERTAPLGGEEVSLLYHNNGRIDQRPVTVSSVVGSHSQVVENIKVTDRRYEMFTYPLLDPTGCSGWFETFNPQEGRVRYTDAVGNSLTMFQYARYKLMQCEMLRRVPRLAQEWALDMMSRIDSFSADGLCRVLSSNNERRISSMRELTASSNVHQSGRKFVVPQSIRGSWKDRQDKVHRGMAHVIRYGPPTFFITFTANPNWTEIQQLLPAHCSWYHCPDIVNRVFKLKLDELLDGLRNGKYLGGRSVYIQHVIEFQKRGLVHAHILCRLHGEQPLTASAVDKLISAKIPTRCGAIGSCACDKCRLHDYVIEHMCHHHRTQRCFTDAKGARLPTCKYEFPRASCLNTYQDERGKWVYARQDADSCIVPYSPVLLLRYNAHINVEIACSSRSILYLRKYLSKRLDTSNVRFQRVAGSMKEAITNFFEARTVTAGEAMWKLLGFPFHSFFPTTMKLSVHLPDEEVVIYDPEDIAELPPKYTSLMMYFARPLGPEMDTLLYEQYFSLFHVEKRGTGQVDFCDPPNHVRLRTSPIVAFVPFVAYQRTEQFSLLCLLLKVPARSFEEMRFGESSFEAAAKKHGIFGDSVAYIYSAAMTDAIRRMMPSDELRKLFAGFLIAGVDGVWGIFKQFWVSMCDVATTDDHFEDNSPRGARWVLRQIQKILARDGIDFCSYYRGFENVGLGVMEDVIPQSRARDFYDESFASVSHHHYVLRGEQQTIFQQMVDSIVNGDKKIFLNGSAGSGKTYLLNALITHLVVHRNMKTLTSAFTGKASSLLLGAVTCHRLFGLPMSDEQEFILETTTSTISGGSFAADLLRASDVLIIDEVSMLHKNYLKIIDLLLRDLMNTPTVHFGGKTVILAGDFKQNPPIVRAPIASLESSTVNASLCSVIQNDSYRVFLLHQSQRTQNLEFHQFLETVGNGNTDCDVELPQYIRVVHEIPSDTESLLAPYHDSIDSFNRCCFMRKFPDPQHIRVFESQYVPLANTNTLSLQNLKDWETVRTSNVPRHKIELAVGVSVVLLRNILPREGLTNGQQMVVKYIGERTVTCHIPSLSKDVIIFPIAFTLVLGGWKMNRVQIPLDYAYGITITRSQGMTISETVLDLRTQCFMHGQLYVAISRMKDPIGLTVVLPVEKSRKATNVVYKQIISVIQ